MELTIHIGPHKTGTTAVQTAFAESTGALRRTGLLYPRTNWLYPAQHRLAFAMKKRAISAWDRPDLKVEIARLRKAVERFRDGRIVISSEEFFAAPRDSIALLREALPIETWRIVTFLRRPDEFLVSCYNQKIRQPGNGFSFPIRRFIKTPKMLAPEIDYLACVSAWAEVFGERAIHLERYEAGPPLRRLCDILGVPDGLVRQDRVINKSASGAVAEIMRHAKAIGMAAGQQRKLYRLAEFRFGDAPPYFVADEDRRSVVAAFEADNTILFRRFGQENPYASSALAATNPPAGQNLILQDLMRLIGELL